MKTTQEKQLQELRKAVDQRLDEVSSLIPAEVVGEIDTRLSSAFETLAVAIEQLSWTPVDSTNLKAVRYHPENEQLDVKFHNDTVYEYMGVQQGLFETLLGVESKGRYFNTSIKPFFECVKRIK